MVISMDTSINPAVLSECLLQTTQSTSSFLAPHGAHQWRPVLATKHYPSSPFQDLRNSIITTSLKHIDLVSDNRVNSIIHPDSVVVLVAGPPGVGKGSLCGALSKVNANVLHVSVGDEIRKILKNKSHPISQRYHSFVQSGRLLPDDVILKIIKAALSRFAGSKKLILLDGYPRSMVQLKDCQKLFEGQLVMVSLTLDEDSAIERIQRRGEGRSDDTEAVIKDRMRLFHLETQPVIEALRQQEGFPAITISTRNDDREQTKTQAIAQKANQLWSQLQEISAIKTLCNENSDEHKPKLAIRKVHHQEFSLEESGFIEGKISAENIVSLIDRVQTDLN